MAQNQAKASHTRGPWYVCINDHYPENPQLKVEGPFWDSPACIVVHGHSSDEETSQANADLISAAPTLLELVKMATAIVNPRAYPDFCARSAAAIAKAEGYGYAEDSDV